MIEFLQQSAFHRYDGILEATDLQETRCHLDQGSGVSCAELSDPVI